MASSVINTLRPTGVVIRSTEQVSNDSTYDRKREALRHMKREARVILLSVAVDSLRDFMLAAYDENMVSGDFVFFSMQEDPDVSDVTENQIWRKNDSRDRDARIAMETLFHVAVYSNFSLFNATEMEKLRDLVTQGLAETLKPPWTDVFPERKSPSTYSGSLTDALTMYMTTYVEMKKMGQNPLSGVQVFSHFKNRSFVGLLGDIIMDEKADRRNNFVALDMDEKGNFVPLHYYEWRMMDGNLTLSPRTVRTVVWAKGKVGLEHVPKAYPVCGFDGSLCSDDRVMAISATCATIGTLFIIFVVVIFFVRRNQKSSMTKTIWRVDYDHIDFRKTLTYSKSQRSLRSSRRGLTTGDTAYSRTLNITASVSIPSLMDDDIDEIRKQVFTLIGMYHGSVVAIRKIRKNTIHHNFSLYQELAKMRGLQHPNVNAFIGACIELPNPFCLVWTYCGRGSLADVLWNEEMKLDTHFKWSFMSDIAKGMEYLHHSFLESHGRLKSTNVVVDSRWTCKVTDYGARLVLGGENAKEGQNEDSIIAERFWTAPELLQETSRPRYGTKKGDIYSFGIIVKEIQTRSGPYSEFEDLKPKDIIMRIENPRGEMPFRPRIDHDILDGDHGAVGIARACWEQDPDERPSFSKVNKMISHYRKGLTNIMDNMVQMLEKYADSLEETVADRTELLEQEKRKTDLLLYRMLPPTVADALKQGRRVNAEWYEDVTIYFSDVVGFTTLASESTPMQIVDMLNSLYTLFDDVITLYDVYKVETIGDAYMIVSGLPERNGRNHVIQIANTALSLRDMVDTGFTVPHLPHYKLQIRIGLNTGPCAAGVVGLAMPRYCLFGDTVNTASRMESHGEAMKIHMSNTTYQALSELGCYKTFCRGEILIKGKGQMVTYFLEGKEVNEVLSSAAIGEDMISDIDSIIHEETLVNGGVHKM